MSMRRAAHAIVVTLIGCGVRLVPIVPDGPGAGTVQAPSDASFEVVAHTAGVRDPLPVSGTSIAFADLEPALARAVLRAVRPKQHHTLTVELVAADAEYAGSRLAISLVARATLRTRDGNVFVAQTQAICRDSAIVEPGAGAAVVWSCMARLGKDLGGWLDGLQPRTDDRRETQ
jgi:hypothetical protein